MKKFIYSMICIWCVALFVFGHNMPKQEETKSYICYEVQIGDTLWRIAREICLVSADRYRHDPREVIYEINSLNALGKFLRVGQEIKVPVYVTERRMK